MTTLTIAAPESDFRATVSADDLRALLEIAANQADCMDEDEAEGMGLTLERALVLHAEAVRLLEMLPRS